MKKALVVIAVLLGFAASLRAQSLAELARQEKARRAGLAHHAAVVKSEELRLVKLAPAVEVSRPEGWVGESVAAAEPNAGAVEATEASAPEPAPARPAAMANEAGGPLDEQLKSADALVEELTTEMNSLQQQFASQNAMVPGSVIQQQIDDAYQRLVLAQERQAELRKKMGSRAPAPKKEAGDPGR